MKPQPASIEDLINYKPEKYLSDDEMSLLRNTFKGNPKLIKVLRKLFLPTFQDPDLPIEEIKADMFLGRFDFMAMDPAQIKPIVAAMQEAQKLVFGGLIKLKVLANTTEETEEQIKLRRKQDSTK